MVYHLAQLMIRNAQLDGRDRELTREGLEFLFSKGELFLQAEYGAAASSRS